METKRTFFTRRKVSALSRLFLFTLGLSTLNCSPETPGVQEILEKHLDAIYPNGAVDIQNISTLANCQSPNGSYITITESEGEGDYVYFHQNFFYKDNFSAVAMDTTTIFMLDDSLNIIDTLSPINIFVVKSHEFHKIALKLDEWFRDFTLAADTTYNSVSCKQLMAVDSFDKRHHLFFDQETGRCVGFQFSNPGDETEKIRTFYKDWGLQGDLMLFDKVEILQGTDQRYTFDFDRVQINSDEFKTLKY